MVDRMGFICGCALFVAYSSLKYALTLHALLILTCQWVRTIPGVLFEMCMKFESNCTVLQSVLVRLPLFSV